MPEPDRIRAFYQDNPRMVSSPFGGVDGIDTGLLRDVLQRLGIALEGRRVLDVGCGRGYAAAFVQEQGGTYLGCDFVVSRAGFPLARGDAAQLPFATNSADLLFCVDASEHFPEPAQTAAEFHRVLRPGGTFFLCAPNYGNIAGIVKRVCEGMGWYAPNTWAPFGRWQPQEFEQCLSPGYIKRLYRNAGFQFIRAVPHGPEAGLGLFPWMDHPKTPEAIQFRLQALFRTIGPGIAWALPRTSLHLFWRFDKPNSHA